MKKWLIILIFVIFANVCTGCTWNQDSEKEEDERNGIKIDTEIELNMSN